MATQTSNLGLTKPGYDEAADVVPAVNNNMDTLDAKIGAVPANSSVQGQLDSHTQAIGNLSNLTTTEKGSLVGAANELNSKLNSKFTFGDYHILSDVISFAASMPDGSIAFVSNSNKPTNRPSGGDWGSYLFFKAGTTTIIYFDASLFCHVHNVSGSEQSLNWITP